MELVPEGEELTVDMESAGVAGSGAANGSLASDGERLAGKHLGLDYAGEYSARAERDSNSEPIAAARAL